MNNQDKIHTLSRAVIINQEHILLAYDPREKPYHYYKLNKKFVVERIVNYIENYKDFVGHVQKQRLKLKERYFSGKALYNSIAK